MKVSLIKRIELYAQKNPFWISGLDYEVLAFKAGYKASNCGRRLRELHTAGILERREVKGHVEYRYKQSPEKNLVDMIYNQALQNQAMTSHPIFRAEEKQKVESKVEAGVQKALV